MNDEKKQNPSAYPAHPYNGRLGSGIKLIGGTSVEIHLKDQIIAQESLDAPISEWDFWYGLRFASLFPEITHWFFYSGWTQLARLRVVSKTMDGTANGFMQFVSEENASQLWFLEDGYISAPYPAGENFPMNIPLRMALSQMIYNAVFFNKIVQDRWYPVTSLVPSYALENTFPIVWGNNWHIEKDGPKNMRQCMCSILGLSPEK